MRAAYYLALVGLSLAFPALADNVKIESPWVRATAPGQKVAAGFMELTADADMKLVGGSSPISKNLELHMMSMDDGVMIMRQIPEIALPENKKVHLAPGGLHIMFIDLQQQVKEGDMVPVTLVVRNGAGKEQILRLEAKAMKMGGMRHH
ncbi:MAG: copper chaperone PCu(A)C [Pseudomonadota bacterium]